MASLPWHLPPPGLRAYDVSRFCRIISAPNRQNSMFAAFPFVLCMFRKHCDPNFRTKLWRRCVPQGNLPPFCIIALTAFAIHNAPMPVFVLFHRRFREIFATCWQHPPMEFERTRVSQGISAPFCVAALARFPSHNVATPLLLQYHGGFHIVLTTYSPKLRMNFEPTFVSQGVSPPFGVVALEPLPSRIARL